MGSRQRCFRMVIQKYQILKGTIRISNGKDIQNYPKMAWLFGLFVTQNHLNRNCLKSHRNEHAGIPPPGPDPSRSRPPPPEHTLPEQTPPTAEHAGRYGQRAGGTLPTGMQSCAIHFSISSLLQHSTVIDISIVTSNLGLTFQISLDRP